MIPPDCESNQDCLNGNYFCGVVEGFYGRPWTTEERRKLFRRMSKMGMNMYVYAPKDDCKHRMYWRELYSVEEADHLTGLIDAAKESNVTFVYAISPGLDITFSSSKETTFLKRKLEQVVSFGCTSFALLFDDIESDMSEADKEIYQSFAHAQVSITNEVFQHLSQPANFLFCPTEYCATRAVPDVPSSEYLTTVGSKLLPGIDILWTGPKVISKKISVKSVIEVSKVLKRPPVIWDNIHANDYDPKRVFLGPYAGRSPELIPYTKGVLTNPNCEFEANYVALHTLTQWCRSNVDGVKKDLPLEESTPSADVKLETETEGEYSDDEFPNCMYEAKYKPKLAMAKAIKDWLPEFDSINAVSSKTVQETLALTKQKMFVQQPVVPTCSVITPTTSSNNLPPSGVITSPDLNSIDSNASYLQPTMSAAPMNSLMDPSSSDSETESTVEMLEPMDTLSTPGSSPPITSILLPSETRQNLTPPTCDNESKSNNVKTAEGMQVDSLPCTTVNIEPQPPVIKNLAQPTLDIIKSQITPEEAVLLVELFYLPFEYGKSAVSLLKDFEWLKMHAYVVTDSKKKQVEPEQKQAAAEWISRAAEFENLVQRIHTLSDKFSVIPNKMLLYNLFPYIWDVRATVSIMSAIVMWLGLGHMLYSSLCYMQGGQYTWSHTAYQEAFTSGIQEPWVFQGGLQAELKRMLPVEADLLSIPLLPRVPTASFSYIRPYKPSDEAQVYNICLRTCDDGMDGTEIFSEHPDLIGDRFAGSFLTLSPELCFVLEVDGKVIGYCLATHDAKSFHSKGRISWIPEMQQKYPKPDKEQLLSPAEEMINSFYSDHLPLDDGILIRFPGLLRLNILPCCLEDNSASKKLLITTIAALRATGVSGVHCEVHVGDKNIHDSYKCLGFFEVPLADQNEEIQFLGRAV